MRVWVGWTFKHIHSRNLHGFDAPQVGRIQYRDETGQAYLGQRAGASDNEASDGKRTLQFVAAT